MCMCLSDAERLLGALAKLDQVLHLVESTHFRITQLEATVATAAEQLTTLSGKVDDLVSDVRAALDILRADRENLTEAGQAAFDELDAKVDAFDTEIGDADRSDVPDPEPTPEG